MRPRPHIAIAAILVLAALPAEAAAKELRCGWLLNPTPANWTLIDRYARWTVATQGGHQAMGLKTMPDMKGADWVVTNVGSYGYGCACMTVDTDARRRIVTRIHSARVRKLAACQADKALPRL
jgi:hypothetical protein